MVFLPLMSREKALRPRQLFATCVAVILPVCAVSAAVCLLRMDFDFLFALPYLIGRLPGRAPGRTALRKGLSQAPPLSLRRLPPLRGSEIPHLTSARKELPP